jgi:Lanthionine synthetase C-like protein/Protein kinase domain
MVELARAALQRDGAEPWKVWVDDLWCYARPPAHHLREQGWKLHLAATRSSAAAVLERALAPLAALRCAFKFASSLEQVALLNSRHYPRGGAGKFLTAYPDDDEQFLRLAEQLDRATAGLAGPAILSDRPLRPGSLVHYRYGGFAGPLELSNDGDYRAMLTRPDGTRVEDRRDAWFSAPDWAPAAPLPAGATPAPAAAGPSGASGNRARPVLLGGRFVVREAIRHANKGGVFRAADAGTGADVVIKQARPHVEADEAGRDARDRLRHEAEVLERLAPLGIAPRKLALFEQDGHVFLAEELLPGVTLRRWVDERCGDRPGLERGPAVELARQLVALLAAVHDAGLVLRDLTPNNVMVDPDGLLHLVDLELAAPPGTPAMVAGTPAYAAPEQLKGALPGAAADLYSLGAIVFLLATGGDPAFLEDRPPLRPTCGRVAAWLEAVAPDSQAAVALAPMIIGLMEPAPERRWPLARAREFLERLEPAAAAAAARTPPGGGRRARTGEDLDRLIEGGLDHLVATMTPGDRERLWPSTCFGASTDPCNVQHGAAGVIAVLATAARLGLAADERLAAALRGACAWVELRLPKEPRLLPGLYFGRSGTAWALHDAAAALGDEGLAARALALAKRLPLAWPNPDVAHGAAGAGLAHLHLWRVSGDGELGARVIECADGLVAAAERGTPDHAGGPLWPVPASFDSRFAGTSHYGFAHGVAGIAWFLLAAGLACGRGDYVALATQGGGTLAAAAQREDGAAWWGSGPSDRTSRMAYWCNGAAGVGTFLVRLAAVSGDERTRQLAEAAAVAARRVRWRSTPAACHGLAGNGEFLLDMAWLLGEQRYRAWAEELAAAILARHAYRDGRMVVPDESGTGLAADYGVGLAGVLAFLLRLRHGGERAWMTGAPVTLEARP